MDVASAVDRRAALALLLNQVPDGIVIAQSPNSARVPMPDADCFRGMSTLPGDTNTFIDVVVPADRMIVVTAWEKAQTSGWGEAVVRVLGDPGRALRLVYVDARDDFGVCIAVLAGEGQWQAGGRGPVLDAALLAPRRPRTASVSKNQYAMITEVDDRMTRMLGWSAEELIGRRSLEFLHPDSHERAINQWLEVRQSHSCQRVRVQHEHRDGSWLWVEIENTYLGGDDPDQTVVVSLITDISDEMAAHEAVRQRESLFHKLAESLPAGVFVLAADRTVLFANARLTTTLGVETVSDLSVPLSAVLPSQRERLEAAFSAALDEHRDDEMEVDVVLPTNGARRRVLFTMAALSQDDGVIGAVVTATDITASALLREDLTVRATFDPLTGCYNRGSILAALTQTLNEPNAHTTAVMFLDLDQFKPVNDRYGHAVGDQLLMEVTRRLSSTLRLEDRLGRVGGDEFLVICPNVDGADQALMVARRITLALAAPVEIGGHEIRPSASIGVALSTPGTDAETLVGSADAAMYESKRHGDGTPVLAAPEIRQADRALTPSAAGA